MWVKSGGIRTGNWHIAPSPWHPVRFLLRLVWLQSCNFSFNWIETIFFFSVSALPLVLFSPRCPRKKNIYIYNYFRCLSVVGCWLSLLYIACLSLQSVQKPLHLSVLLPFNSGMHQRIPLQRTGHTANKARMRSSEREKFIKCENKAGLLYFSWLSLALCLPFVCSFHPFSRARTPDESGWIQAREDVHIEESNCSNSIRTARPETSMSGSFGWAPWMGPASWNSSAGAERPVVETNKEFVIWKIKFFAQSTLMPRNKIRYFEFVRDFVKYFCVRFSWSFC